MTVFSVKVTTRHEGCKRTCKLDVIATDWLAAGRKALELVQPQGAHRLSVSPSKQTGAIGLPLNWTLATLALVTFFALQAFVNWQENAIAEQSLSANISGAILQCLPEEVDEICTIALIQDQQQLRLVTERHVVKKYGQGPAHPKLKYVVALGGAK